MANKRPQKTSIYTLNWKEKILYYTLISVMYTISLLPLCVLYILSDVLYILVYHVIGYRKSIVQKNLSESFPDKTKDEIHHLMKKHYHFLCDYIVETVKLMSVSKSEMRRRMRFFNIEVVNNAEREGRGVSLYLAHYCNWEWVTAIGLHLQKETLGAQIYHVLESRVSDKLFLFIRSRMGTMNIPMQDILRKRIECKKNNKTFVVGYIADQTPFWNNIHYWTDFLHHDTPVLTGAETITKKFNDVAVYLDISRPKRGYYNVQIIPISTESKDVPDFEITREYFRLLEESIKRQPELWLWTHNRWKRTREEWIIRGMK